MQFQWWEQLFTLLALVVAAAVLVRGLVSGLFWEYRLIYFMVLYELSRRSLCLVLGLQGHVTGFQGDWGMMAVLITLLLQLFILLLLYSMFDGFSIFRDWQLAASLLLALALAWSGDPTRFVESIVNATLLFGSYLGLVTVIRCGLNRHVRLGVNLKLTLLAVSLGLTFKALVLTTTWQTHLSSTLAVNSIDFLWGLTLLVGLWSYSPPRTEAASAENVTTAGRRLGS